jgi:hypothetical protein
MDQGVAGGVELVAGRRRSEGEGAAVELTNYTMSMALTMIREFRLELDVLWLGNGTDFGESSMSDDTIRIIGIAHTQEINGRMLLEQRQMDRKQ